MRLFTLAAIAAFAAAPLAAQEATPTPTPTPTPTEAAAPIEPLADLVLGQETAPLTIVEYASFTCPHCGAFHKDSFDALKSEYIDTGKVRFIQRDVYFDAPGLWASILAHCEPTKYYPIASDLLKTQKVWLAEAKTGDDIAENLRKIGLKAGLTADQMEACWADTKMVERLVATYQINATKDGLEGTPTFLIGGEKVQNQPWDKLKAVIDAKLTEASAAKPADAAATPTPATDAAATPTPAAEAAATPTPAADAAATPTPTP